MDYRRSIVNSINRLKEEEGAGSVESDKGIEDLSDTEKGLVELNKGVLRKAGDTSTEEDLNRKLAQQLNLAQSAASTVGSIGVKGLPIPKGRLAKEAVDDLNFARQVAEESASKAPTVVKGTEQYASPTLREILDLKPKTSKPTKLPTIKKTYKTEEETIKEITDSLDDPYVKDVLENTVYYDPIKEKAIKDTADNFANIKRKAIEGLPNKLKLGTGLAAGTLGTKAMEAEAGSVRPTKPGRNFIEDLTKTELDDNKLDNFLLLQQGLESSFGQNKNHKVIKSGIHKGDKAVGSYGLLPNTIKDVLTKAGSEINVLGKLVPAENRQQFKDLAKLDKQELAKMVENDPAFEKTIARLLAKEVLFKNKNDLERATYAWEKGSNLTHSKIDPKKLEQSDRIKRARELQKELEKFRVPANKRINRLL
jgi:hypothetical protein